MSRSLKCLGCKLAAACLLILAAPFAAGQHPRAHPTGLKYDLQTEIKIKGIIEELKPANPSKIAGAELAVKNETGVVEVYLCPKVFLSDMGVSFAKGDEIQVTGSKVKRDAEDLILAREVVKGNDTVVLRDGKGAPVWK